MTPAARGALACLLAAQALVAVSCGTHERPERLEQTAPSTRAPSATSRPETAGVAGEPSRRRPAAGPSSSTIADIVRTANTVAIRSARLARARSANDAVQAYAVQIVEDDTAANEKLAAVVKRLGVKPADNSASRVLIANADRARASFETQRGATFDRSYIDNEIGFQHQVLDLFDKRLIPAAADSALRALLVTQRATLEAHLDHANHVQAALSP